jgi:ribosomal protein L33
MSQNQLIQLKNKETGEVYWSRKNKKTVEKKIELKKYSAAKKGVVFYCSLFCFAFNRGD